MAACLMAASMVRFRLTPSPCKSHIKAVMHTRLFCSLWLALLAFFPCRAETNPPNIILIISDDHTFDSYGFMGNEKVQTPHLDRIASESLLYTRGYSMPVCSPSLACLLTGLYPHQNGITGNDLSEKAPQAAENPGDRNPLLKRLLSNPVILPKVLSEHGYLTFQTGKLWNASYKDMGFTHGMTANAGRAGGEGLKIGREGMEPIYEFIKTARREDKPFFVWYAPYLPHLPHNPPKRLLQNYRGMGLPPAVEKYYAMVEWLDETCGELDEWLAKNNLRDNTVLIYISDNGWNERGKGPAARAKLTPYERGIRSPVFVRWPGKVPPLRDEETLASIVDFVPTILKAAGAEVPESLPGLDLLDREAMISRKSIFAQSSLHTINDLDNPANDLTGAVVLDGWWKLIQPGPKGHVRDAIALPKEVELFDLKNDPYEKNNLAKEHPEEVARLKAIQDAFWKFQ